MEWTTNPPTKDGYYWARFVYREPGNPQEKEAIEIVDVDMGYGLAIPCVESDHSSEPFSTYTHWMGPLEVPPSPIGSKKDDA